MQSNGSAGKKVTGKNYQEAVTTSDEDSDNLDEGTDIEFKENLFAEKFKNIKNLFDELENSIKISNSLDNNLMLQYVLSQIERQSLSHKISEKNKNLTNPPILVNNKISKYTSCSDLVQEEKLNRLEEVQGLYRNISELEEKVRNRESTIGILCHKYLYLKSNKDKMEKELKDQIYSLERLLFITRNILREVQKEYESQLEKYLSKTKNTFEALFLQEKWRCNKLMYENVRLSHEIKRLQDHKNKNKTFIKNEDGYWEIKQNTVDKSTSEPIMKRFWK